MKLSYTLAVAILSAITAQGLVIPSANELPSAFVLKPEDGVSAGANIGKYTEELLPLDMSAPIVSTEDVGRDIIPHSYIIVLKKNITPEEVSYHREWVQQNHAELASTLYSQDPAHSFFLSTDDAKVDKLGGISDMFSIGDAINGYIGYFLDDAIDLIRRNPFVEFVEKDSRVYANEFNTQVGSPWGLSRISHREALNLGTFNKYLYDDDAGKGVTAYVIDTGVNVSHEEFGKRAKWGKTIPANDFDEDGNGHGTHCAGTIGSEHYGVAKEADIVAVKVLKSNGSGTMSDVVKGVEYAAKSHVAAAKEKKKGFKGSTANMSLGGGKSPALDMAVNAAVKAGLHFAVAAGNENQDACNTSPASAENAITVGASTISDARAYFSNYGKCVDVFAPGLNILSTYIGSDRATATLSGTSMASPHVCGLLTYFLSLQPEADSEFFNGASSGVTPEQLKKRILSFATEDVLSDIPEDTPNKLIFNGAGHELASFWNAEADSESAEWKQVDRILEEVSEAAKLNKVEDKIEIIIQDVKGMIKDMGI